MHKLTYTAPLTVLTDTGDIDGYLKGACIGDVDISQLIPTGGAFRLIEEDGYLRGEITIATRGNIQFAKPDEETSR